jgi:hypothetical protein
MKTKKGRGQRPVWIWLVLIELKRRVAALVSFWLSVALAVGLATTAIWLAVVGVMGSSRLGSLVVTSLVIGALAMVLAAVGYGLAIRWVDRHDDWE